MKVEVQGQMNPRLAIYEVPSEIEEADLKNAIPESLNEGDDIVVKHKFGPRAKHYTHWVVEVNAAVRKTPLKSRLVIVCGERSFKGH